MNKILIFKISCATILGLLLTLYMFQTYNNKQPVNDISNKLDSLKTIYDNNISKLNHKLDSLNDLIKHNDSIILIKNNNIIKLTKDHEKAKTDIIKLDINQSIELFTKNFEEANNTNN